MNKTTLGLCVLLTLLWACMWGTYSPWAMLGGFVIALPLLATVHRLGRDYRPGTWKFSLRLIPFFAYFAILVIKSNIQVVKVVIAPQIALKPRIVRYSVEGLNDMQITTIANAITLTPGTLSMGLSEDKRWLYIHCMFGADRDAAIRDLDDLKNRILREVC